MELEKLKEVLLPFLDKNNFYLYDIKKTSIDHTPTYQVFVDKKGGINVDELVIVNNFLSDYLDLNELVEENYQLEVSSPGAERDIRNYQELEMAIGSYIHLEKNGMKYDGYFLELKNDIIILRVNLKGRFKNFEFNYQEVSKIHYMVKL